MHCRTERINTGDIGELGCSDQTSKEEEDYAPARFGGPRGVILKGRRKQTLPVQNDLGRLQKLSFTVEAIEQVKECREVVAGLAGQGRRSWPDVRLWLRT